MNKKSVILFFSALVLLTLGVFYVIADLDSLLIPYIGYGDVENYIGSDNVYTVNLTLTADSNTNSNITNVTFTFDTANISWYPVSKDGDKEVINGTNAGILTNITYDSTGTPWEAWRCINDSASNLTCWTNSTTDGLGGPDVLGDLNTTLIVSINITAVDNDMEEYEINFIANNNETGNQTSVKTLNSDTAVPVIIDLNVTDGQTTIFNATNQLIGHYALSTGTDWTVSATIWDTNLEEAVLLAYRCDEAGELNWTGVDNETWITSIPEDGKLRLVTGIINKTQCFRGNDVATYNVTFAFLANDSWNQVITLNHTGAASFAVAGQSEYLPRILKVNATATLNEKITTLTNGTGLDGTSDYLPADTITFNIEVAGDKSDDVYIVFNDSGAGLTSIKPKVTNAWEYTHIAASKRIILYNISDENVSTSNEAANNATAIIYSNTLSLVGNDTNEFVFWVYVNNTGGNYTAIGSHRFIVDGAGPSIVMAPPTDRTINPKNSITYECTPTDALSGVHQVKWEVQKPDATWVTLQDWSAMTTTSDTVDISESNTNLAGTYNVKCSFKDNVGNIETKTTNGDAETFSVHFSTTTPPETEVGPSAAAKMDLSTQEEVTIKEKQGVITTFTLDGETIHKITIKEVTLTTVTIVIESDPIEIILKIGETKEVDIDSDGENDISITLNSISDDSVVDLTTKRLTPLPEITPTEEVPPTETPTEVIPEEAPSKAWLWILIIVIIAVVGVGYWFMKKK